MVKKIIITGINGSVASKAAKFFLQNNYEVWGTLRPNRSLIDLPVHSDRLITMDLIDELPLSLPEGIDAIIHCAAATSEYKIEGHISRSTNVLGTERLLNACIQAQIPRFIYISSMSANPANPSNYSQSKLASEAILMKQSQIEYVILRPGLVVTEDGRGVFNKLVDYVNKLPIIPIIGNNKSLGSIAISDLCEAIKAAIEIPEASGKIIDVSAPEALDLKDIVLAVARNKGKKVRCLRIPYSLAMLVASVTGALGKPLITKDNVLGLQYARKADATNLRQILKVNPKMLDESLQHITKKGVKLI